ncbi:MAG: lipid A deacylase LpxR family protein [Pseudomonadota bacterium]
MTLLRLCLLSPLICLLGEAASAEPDAGSAALERAGKAAFFTFRFENDYFFGLDKHYTSGLRFGYVTPEGTVPIGAEPALKALGLVGKTAKLRTQYALSQHIYTPDDIEVANPPLTDRPYAGLLTFDTSILAQSKTHLDIFGISVGVTGRPSLAQDLQIGIHSLLPSSPRPEGWATQVPFEPVFQAKYDRIQYIGGYHNTGIQLDFQPRAGFDLGNAFVNGYVGGQVRLGNRLYREPGAGLNRPGAPGVDWFAIPEKGQVDIYAFLGFDARLVGRNVSLDGGLRDFDRAVDRDIFVTDISAGGAVASRLGRITFTAMRRQREFSTQVGPDWYGSLSISVPF